MDELKAIEEQAEVAIGLPLEFGQKAYQLAQSLRKRVLLILDSYLDSRVVADILKRCGYSNYERLFVSSDFGKLKASGTLFSEVKPLVSARPWLHVGDHPLSDVRVPERLGIRTHHEPSATVRYARDPFVRADSMRSQRSLGAQIPHGVIARKFFDGSARTSKRFTLWRSSLSTGSRSRWSAHARVLELGARRARRDEVTDRSSSWRVTVSSHDRSLTCCPRKATHPPPITSGHREGPM